MIRQISIKTKLGWISAFEEKDKIVRVKFGKYKNKSINKNLKNFRHCLNDFLTGKIKSIVFRKYLDTGKYRRIRLFDDSMENLLALLALRDDYPNISFEAYRVSKKGAIKTIR